jgi:hypothetical protein
VDILVALWLGGIAVCAGIVAMMRVTSSWVLGRSGQAAAPDLLATVARMAERLGVRRTVRVLVTKRPLGPAVFGMIRPTLVLPEPLASSLSPEQIEPILAHELVHIRRGDVTAGFLQVLAVILWWFHPLVWWVNRNIGRERERCCDEESLAGLGCEPGQYARALLNVLELKLRLRPLLTLPGVRPLDLTRQRLEHIMACKSAARTTRGQWLILATVAAVLVPGAGLAGRVVSLPAGGSPVTTAVEPLTVKGDNITTARVEDDPAARDRLKAEVERLGGSLQANSDKLVSVVLERTAVTDADLGRIAPMIRADDQVSRLVLGHTRFGDAGLAHLKHLTGLTWLYLEDTDTSDAGLTHLKDLTNLVGLTLENTGVGDEGMKILAGMPKLAWLTLGNTQVGDGGLGRLSGLHRLEVLTLENTPITDASLAHLKGLTRLRYLHLDNTRVGDAGLASLKGLVKMQRLYLRDTDVTDAGLASLERMKDLYYLMLHNSLEPDMDGFRNTVHVSNAGLEHLRGLTKLRSLFLWNTAVTETGVERLKKAIPGLDDVAYGENRIVPFWKKPRAANR